MELPGASEREAATNHKKKGLLKDQLELAKQTQQNGKTRWTIKPMEEQLSFDKGFFIFIRAVKTLTQHNKGVVVVGLAGPSGSGKTAFSQKIQTVLTGCAVLSMDNYNDGSRVIDSNFDDPRLTDYDTLLANIQDLQEGRATQVPIYDFKVSKRVGYRQVEVPSSRVVIIEGIYALSSRLRPLEDLRVSITGGVHFDLVKRVLRDIERSGQQPAEIIQQISDTVYPMYKAFIEPDLKTAHLRIYNTFNPFAGFMNATYILKSAKPVAAEDIRAVLKANHRMRSESETYDIYLLPPGEDPETCQSWLRMRNRDGRYNLMFEEWVTDGPFIISPRITFEFDLVSSASHQRFPPYNAEEWVTDTPFIMSLRIMFKVNVRILGGLMALGYEIGSILKRTSRVWQDDQLMIKIDEIDGMEHKFVQIQGKDRAGVAAAGSALGLDGTYIARSYIEQLQLDNLVTDFQKVTEDLKRRFVVNGEPLIEEGMVVGGSPMGSGSFKRMTGFTLPQRPTMASSAPVDMVPPGPRSTSDDWSNSGTAEPRNGALSHLMRSSENGAGGGLAPLTRAASQLPGTDNGSGHLSAHIERKDSHRLLERCCSDELDGLHQQPAATQVDRQLQHLRSRLDQMSPQHSDASVLAEQVQALVTSNEHLTHELRMLMGILLRESSSPRSLAPAYQQEAVLMRPQSRAILSDFPWPSAAAFACTGALAMLVAARLLKL